MITEKKGMPVTKPRKKDFYDEIVVDQESQVTFESHSFLLIIWFCWLQIKFALFLLIDSPRLPRHLRSHLPRWRRWKVQPWDRSWGYEEWEWRWSESGAKWVQRGSWDGIHSPKSKNKKKSKGERQGEQRKAVKEETEKVDDLSEEVVVNINQQEDQENENGDRNIV